MRAFRPILPACALCLLAPAAGAQSSFFNVVSVERTVEGSAGWNHEFLVTESESKEGLGVFDIELSTTIREPITGGGGSASASLESRADHQGLSVVGRTTAMKYSGGNHQEKPGVIFGIVESVIRIDYAFEVLRPASIELSGAVIAHTMDTYDELPPSTGLQLSAGGDMIFSTDFTNGQQTLDSVLTLVPGLYRLSLSSRGFEGEDFSRYSTETGSLDVEVRFIPAPTTAAPLLLAFGAIARTRRRT